MVIQFARTTDRINNGRLVLDKLAENTYRNTQRSTSHADELVAISRYLEENKNHSHKWLDENGWEFRTATMVNENGSIFDVLLNIAKARDGRRILYDINKIKKVGRTDVTRLRGSVDKSQLDNEIVSERAKDVNSNSTIIKQRQAEIIAKANPRDERLGDHTWVNSADDIKTFSEAVKDKEAALDVDSLANAMSVAAPIFSAAGYKVNDAAQYMGVMDPSELDAMGEGDDDGQK